MDISIPIIFIVLFIVASFSLLLVYKFGIKEKSYEEALAEQRQQTNALLGVKSKTKEKKSKKAAKKPKEKELKEKHPIVQENETDESGSIESNNTEKPHVEFKEEPEEVPDKDIPVVPLKPKRIKKVRPILIKKEKSPVRFDLNAETPVANHFEENPPKDDFELLRSNSRDDILKQEPVKEKLVKEKKATNDVVPPMRNKKEKSNKQSSNNAVAPVNSSVEKEVREVKLLEDKVTEKEIIEAIAVLPSTNGVIIGNPGKEKKKKKSDFNTRQQLTADRDGLINSVRKAELSKTEVQLLIDLLLNKQLEAPAVIDEWSEGKSDPVQKMKKQLAEKEKALAEEQEALVGAQAKLREIRSEQQTEKAQLQQKIRTLEEVVQNKQLELQAINNRMTQKMQQLQADLNNEMMKSRKILEDKAAMQMQLQQIQETDNILAKQRVDLEEFSAQNQQLRLELQQAVGEKDHQYQQFILQMNNLEKTLEQQNEVNRQIKEANQKFERQQEEWDIEITNLKTAFQQQYEEKLKLEHTLHQRNEEIRIASTEKVENSKLISQLQSQMNGVSQDSKNYEVEVLNLSNELSSLNGKLLELQQAEKKYKTETETSNNNYRTLEKELEEQKEKNNELRTKNWKVMEALNAAENKNKAGDANKNQKQSDIDLKKLTQEVIIKEQDSQKQFIQRLFPEIEGLKAVTSDDWQTEFGKLIKSYIGSLRIQQKESSPQKSQDVTKLHAQLQHYKNIIDDTEGMLNKLQSHIEKEEINWRNQLAAKESEIERLKESHLTQNPTPDTPLRTPDIQGVQFAYKCIEKSLPVIIDELQAKVATLEEQLSREINEKQQLSQDLQLLKSKKTPTVVTVSDSTATIEKLSEEVNRLREQLRLEQTRNGDVSVCLKAQNNCNNSVNGPTFIEHCLSSSSSLASSVIEGLNKKPKNKKRKKKVPAIRNANICSNMGCQFLYCDGNNCQGNL